MRYLFALLLLALTPQSEAIVYEWSGDCVIGCTGTAHAEIVLKNYVPGQTFVEGFGDPQYFVSFKYSDNISTLFFNYPDFAGGGTLPTDTDLAHLDWCFNSCADFRFHEATDGSWLFKTEITQIIGHIASGSNGVFALSVPEPSTLALSLLALFALRRSVNHPTH